ncbi:MAG: UDP-N-acetylmuramate dehydrogenase [Oscillospiraceae bacterium]|nr:UDP-N-acetylmuramate dehydrogenase [Oscillospiraceae bacterium]
MKQLELLGAAAAAKGCRVQYGEPMDRHTTFKIGGPADVLITVETVDGLRTVLEEVHRLEIPCHILGRGSNLLVSDDGIRGAVVLLSGEFSQCTVEGNTITCGAAAPLSTLCRAAQEHSLTGLEFAWGIPGSVGGALFMNAGAYGSEMKNVVVSATHMTMDGQVHTVPLSALELKYRHSVYHHLDAVILSLKVALQPGKLADITAQMEDIFLRRKTKQPLEYPSAGSVFKRPEGHYAGALIEQCGLKGKRIGGAMVSEKHAGFIVNVGGATCQDVLDLVALIQETVQKETGVALECEIRPVG